MRIRLLTLAILTGALCTPGMTPVASAGNGVDVDLGVSVPIGDSGRLWFDIASRHYDYEPRLVQQWAPRYSNPDDLAVSLFLARSSGRTEVAPCRTNGTGTLLFSSASRFRSRATLSRPCRCTWPTLTASASMPR